MPNRRELGYVSAGSTSTIVATTGYGVATGGTSSSITVSSENYTLLSFTSDGNLVVSSAGLFDVLMFGGGGGGGTTTDNGVSGGGGGAGGFVQSTIFLPAATYAVDIGAGGVGTSQPTNGFCSSIDSTARSLAVSGGGSGGGYVATGTFAAGIGGCGGGGAYQPYLTGAVSALPTVGGFAGGDSVSSSASAAGGGGVTAVGANRFSGTVGGAGGAGYDVSAFIGGSALFKGGGGGGGGSTTGGAGGSSVGGAGGSGANNGAAAAANTAGGGGGAGTVTPPKVGGSGGSGIVYVRFKV